jgi:hypothetical protein
VLGAGCDPEVLKEVLVEHGFTQADFDRGWDPLKATSPFTPHIARVSVSPQIVAALDSLENRWFPVARIVLDANYPTISELFFTDLAQTSGDLVIISVTVFVDRLELLEKGAEPFGSDGPAARELLSRGLTPERVAEAKADLDELRDFERPVARVEQADTKTAEDAVWNWYLEWSRLLRHAISNRHWLRKLGLWSRKASKDEPSSPSQRDPGAPGIGGRRRSSRTAHGAG